MVELEHHAKTVNGVRLHYVTAGAGDAVVLLHGWPQTWFAWREVIPILAEHYLVIAPDTRGGSWVVGFNMAGDITEELVRGRERLLVEYWMRHGDVGLTDPTAATDEAIDRYAHATSLPGGLRGSFGYWRAIPEDWDDNRRFGEQKLTMPVLAVRGDQVFEINAVTTMRQAATNVEEVVLARCGHYVPEERPAELAAALLRFFEAAR